MEENGFAPDFQRIDEILIGNNRCPDCRKNLVYKGFSNDAEYKAFGICEPCDYARHFWTEKVEIAISKRKFSDRRRQTA